MGLYEQAFDRDPVDTIGTPVVTPASILAEMNVVNFAVKQLSADIEASQIGQGFRQAWGNFVAEWRGFYESHKGWTDRLWGRAYTQAYEYRQRVNEWRQDFMRAGGKVTGPALPLEGEGFPWGIVLGGVALVAGFFGVRKLLRSLKEPGKPAEVEGP